MHKFRNLSYLFFVILLGLIAFFNSNPVYALESKWDRNDHVSVRLISAVEAVGDLETIPLGLEFEIKKNWKIYWRNPGDAGYPPQPDWMAAENLKDTEILWPLPTRFSILGLESLGYKDHVILPFNVTPQTIGQELRLKGDINYLTCEEICIPYSASLDLTIPMGKADPTDHAFTINQYLSEVPVLVEYGQNNPVGLKVTQTALEEINGENKLSILVEGNEELENLDLFIEGPIGSFFDPPIFSFSEDKKSALVTSLGGGFEEEARQTEPVILTISAIGQSIETSILVSNDASWVENYKPDTQSGLSLEIVLIALLGGLILNLMPCVLPVLSLKVLSIINHGDSSPTKIRISFLATTMGILVAFLVLAAVLAGLKAGGVAIGWGIQFQHPIFLIFMLFVVMAFTANLLGFFEIQLPSQLATSASNASQGSSIKGHFLTGVFATLLATPCSAPFLGTAVGFALSQGSTEIFVIFATLGVGLAAPYLLFMLAPNLAKKLPKPGKWMGWVKLVLAAALVITAIWLVTVLETSVGTISAWLGFVLSCLMLAALYLRKKEQQHRYRQYTFAAIVPVLIGLSSPYILPTKPATAVTHVESDIDWIAFNRSDIDNLVNQGKTVFVDVTADWCITCQYNKRSTLTDAEITKWLSNENVVPMQADWTLPNDDILSYLQTYGRYGIPFNIIYSPDKPKGVILPELLTVESMLEKIEESETSSSN
ncbi:protein-disulfide reductase DsbD family protein [Curvivirga aplysinae]|uniref:protein-disulfide reductase DsbD family protein n=1 Tax=Curvivirga aplysinae TaxID=2529852 RepID=UPI001C3F88A1|nr:protein-disulfide reductase DsbD domain-containing protein [Curvivirga aplysinae]